MAFSDPKVNFTRQGEGRPILLVHGYGGSECSWLLVDDEIAKLGEVTILELVGFGRSTPGSTFGYTLEEQAIELARFLSQEYTEPPTIVAHSMGAAVVIIAMLEHEIDVAEVVFVDALAYPQPTPFFINSQTVPGLSPLIGKIVPPSVQVDIVLRRIFHDPRKISQEIRQCYINEFEIPHHREALRKTAVELSNFDSDRYVSRYSELDAEVHVIWGRDDPLVSNMQGRKLRDDVAAKSYVEIENCGHAPHEECPDEFLREIKRILR